MGQNLAAPKKKRNYLLDILKFLYCIGCTGCHINIASAAILGTPARYLEEGFSSTLVNPNMANSYSYASRFNPIFGMTGYTTIAIFTFLTGYWMVQAFKGYQKRGWIGKGKDMTVIAKYAAKTYASYWPYLFLGTTWGFVFLHVMIPDLRPIRVWITQFMLSIPQFLGIFHLGYDPDNNAFTMNIMDVVKWTNNFEISPEAIAFKWNSGPLWYMFAIIVCCTVFFALMVMNERFAVWVFAPYIFSLYNMTSTVAAVSNLQTYGVNIKWIHMFGPMALGVWGYYIVQWMKGLNITKSGKIGLNILTVATLFFIAWNFIYMHGGMIMHDLLAAILGILVLAERDDITVGINKGLAHIPGIVNFLGFCSVGMYAIHMPIIQWLTWAGNTGAYPSVINLLKKTGTISNFALTFYIFFMIVCIPLYFFDKKVRAGMTNWVLRITKATEPIVFEEKETVTV